MLGAIVVLIALGAAPHGAIGRPGVTPPPRAQVGPPEVLPCRITAANAAMWSHQNASGAVLYYGHIIMDTEGCGVSPAQVAATFQPMTGNPTTCDARGTLFNDAAVCTSAIGAGVPGTTVVIQASGNTAGEGGADAFTAQCTVVLPHLSTISCRFPLGDQA